MTARHDLPAKCPTCLAPWRQALTFTFDPDPIWRHAIPRLPAPWCALCDRPWARWCVWNRAIWRGGPGPVDRHELGVAS